MDKKKIKKIETKILKKPTPSLYLNLAEEYYKLKMVDNAVVTLKKCISKYPDYTSAHVALGKLYMENGYPLNAIEQFEYVVTITPGNLLAYKKLSVLYSEAKEHYKALDTYRRILAINPDDEEARVALELLNEMEREGSISKHQRHHSLIYNDIEDNIEGRLNDELNAGQLYLLEMEKDNNNLKPDFFNREINVQQEPDDEDNDIRENLYRTRDLNEPHRDLNETLHNRQENELSEERIDNETVDTYDKNEPDYTPADAYYPQYETDNSYEKVNLKPENIEDQIEQEPDQDAELVQEAKIEQEVELSQEIKQEYILGDLYADNEQIEQIIEDDIEAPYDKEIEEGIVSKSIKEAETAHEDYAAAIYEQALEEAEPLAIDEQALEEAEPLAIDEEALEASEPLAIDEEALEEAEAVNMLSEDEEIQKQDIENAPLVIDSAVEAVNNEENITPRNKEKRSLGEIPIEIIENLNDIIETDENIEPKQDDYLDRELETNLSTKDSNIEILGSDEELISSGDEQQHIEPSQYEEGTDEFEELSDLDELEDIEETAFKNIQTAFSSLDQDEAEKEPVFLQSASETAVDDAETPVIEQTHYLSEIEDSLNHEDIAEEEKEIALEDNIAVEIEEASKQQEELQQEDRYNVQLSALEIEEEEGTSSNLKDEAKDSEPKELLTPNIPPALEIEYETTSEYQEDNDNITNDASPYILTSDAELKAEEEDTAIEPMPTIESSISSSNIETIASTRTEDDDISLNEELSSIEEYVKKQQFLKAIPLYKKLIAQYPKNIDLKLKLLETRTYASILNKDEKPLINKLNKLYEGINKLKSPKIKNTNNKKRT
ncbi:hypothetical protein MCHI_003671 [Candidatus Magnetoovum chiemensis]|nr:hypothetical protein MCHI_003671 [Candidatus Magnetoovum chiemensis]